MKGEDTLVRGDGGRECWLVDPATRTIEVYVLRDRVYELLNKWGPGESARSEVLEGFEVVVEVEDIVQ